MRPMANASIYTDHGSGLNTAYLENCVLILVATKCFSGLKHKCFNVKFKNFECSIHSVSALFKQDHLLAIEFSFIGM